jgi:hypothetical protein
VTTALRRWWRRLRRTGGAAMGDSMAADYSAKLTLFERFAEPELTRLIGDLPIAPGARVLDAG